MIHKIQILPDTSLNDILFFNEIDFDLLPNPRIIPIFGANGAGKTSLLKGIETAYDIASKIEYLKSKRDGKPMDRQRSLSEIIIEEQARRKQNESDFWNEQIEDKRKRIEIEIDRDNVKEKLFRYRNSDDNLRVKKAKSMNEEWNPYFINNRWNARSLSEGQSIVYSVFDLLKGLKPECETFIQHGYHGLVLIDELDSGLSLDNLDAALRKIKRIVSKRNDVQIFLTFNTSYVLKYFPDVISMYDGKAHHIGTEDEMLDELKKNKKMLDKARKYSNGRYKIF